VKFTDYSLENCLHRVFIFTFFLSSKKLNALNDIAFKREIFFLCMNNAFAMQNREKAGPTGENCLPFAGKIVFLYINKPFIMQNRENAGPRRQGKLFQTTKCDLL